MANADDMNDAVTAFRRTERALKEAFEQTRSLRDTSTRLATTEKALVPVVDSMRGLTDALETLEERFAGLLPQLEKTTAAYLSIQPETLIAALDQAREQVAGLAGSVDEWRIAFATALKHTDRQLKELASTVGSLEEQVKTLVTEIGVMSRMLDERLERWNREQEERVAELKAELGRDVEAGNTKLGEQIGAGNATLTEQVDAGHERLQLAVTELATGQARIRLIAFVATGLALVAAVAAILAAT